MWFAVAAPAVAEARVSGVRALRVLEKRGEHLPQTVEPPGGSAQVHSLLCSETSKSPRGRAVGTSARRGFRHRTSPHPRSPPRRFAPERTAAIVCFFRAFWICVLGKRLWKSHECSSWLSVSENFAA